ncbi:MAG: hypothetical protein AABZ58_14105 [Chloroflexota bacterium]
MLNIYLFDMDAVLLHPGGYRAALIATVNHFSRGLGLGDLAPTYDEIETFEAAGITSEWDSAPISIAAISLAHSRPDYLSLVERVSAEWRRGECPAEAAYRVLFPSPSPRGRGRGDEGEGGIFGANGDWHTAILLHSRDIRRSPVLNVFQQFTLGDAFESTYGLPRTIDAHSTLLKHDRPALSRPVPPQSAIYTARPSKPPRDMPPRIGYAPEAELGAQLVGLSHLPIIGFGSFQWLAETIGGHAELYLKPSPVHGLAAIGAALGGPESESLRAAEAAMRAEWLPPLKDLRGAKGRVTVFEDSASSIKGVREAVGLLGSNWECVGVGISSGGPKRDALAKVADRVYPSLNDALDRELNA